ncbi:MAG: hypothetical protein HFACDABA_01829 [Anaerolineales bacterium]|nr:hypothetical protein [Anaerolineales bacterium]
MAEKKFDGVIEAVRYARNGQIEWVRAYERRGPTFSDRVLLDRKTLLERLRSKKQFITGQRQKFHASTFSRERSVQLVKHGDREYIATRADAARDELEGAPVF